MGKKRILRGENKQRKIGQIVEFNVRVWGWGVYIPVCASQG